MTDAATLQKATDAFLCALPEALRGRLGRKYVMAALEAALASVDVSAAARQLAMVRAERSPPPRLTVLYSPKEDA